MCDLRAIKYKVKSAWGKFIRCQFAYAKSVFSKNLRRALLKKSEKDGGGLKGVES